jgi:hypothetical protein
VCRQQQQQQLQDWQQRWQVRLGAASRDLQAAALA